jgi:hypothetical protein
LSDAYQGLIGQSHPDLFGTITLITPEARDNPAYRKASTGAYFTDEKHILEELGKPRSILPLSVASDLFAPYLATDNGEWSRSLTLVVGDSIDDRLLFWNQHHRHEDIGLSAITGLRLPATRWSDPDFLALIKAVILRRGKPDSDGRRSVTVRSCSVPQSELEKFASDMQAGDFRLAVHAVHHDNHAACVPAFEPDRRPAYRYNLSFPELRSRESLDFRGSQAYVPNAVPWHMREALPPANLRAGVWMIDLNIDRSDDHCPIVNVRHPWILPRRLRLDRSFKIDWPDQSPQNDGERVLRVDGFGHLSLPTSQDRRAVPISIPEDIDAFRHALCARSEWLPFARARADSPQGRPRYAYAEPSDKARYCLAVLRHFDGLPDAFRVLMHQFWRDVLTELGAVPVEKNSALRRELVTTLRKRLGRRTSAFRFDADEDMDRLASEAIRFGRKAGRTRGVPITALFLRNGGPWLRRIFRKPATSATSRKLTIAIRAISIAPFSISAGKRFYFRGVNGNADAATTATGSRSITCRPFWNARCAGKPSRRPCPETGNSVPVNSFWTPAGSTASSR